MSEVTNFFFQNGKLYKTDAEIDDELCPLSKNASRCLQNYAKFCLKPFPRQSLKLLAYEAQEYVEKICNKSENNVERERYVKYSKCGNIVNIVFLNF